MHLRHTRLGIPDNSAAMLGGDNFPSSMRKSRVCVALAMFCAGWLGLGFVLPKAAAQTAPSESRKAGSDTESVSNTVRLDFTEAEDPDGNEREILGERTWTQLEDDGQLLNNSYLDRAWEVIQRLERDAGLKLYLLTARSGEGQAYAEMARALAAEKLRVDQGAVLLFEGGDATSRQLTIIPSGMTQLGQGGPFLESLVKATQTHANEANSIGAFIVTATKFLGEGLQRGEIPADVELEPEIGADGEGGDLDAMLARLDETIPEEDEEAAGPGQGKSAVRAFERPTESESGDSAGAGAESTGNEERLPGSGRFDDMLKKPELDLEDTDYPFLNDELQEKLPDSKALREPGEAPLERMDVTKEMSGEEEPGDGPDQNVPEKKDYSLFLAILAGGAFALGILGLRVLLSKMNSRARRRRRRQQTRGHEAAGRDAVVTALPKPMMSRDGTIEVKTEPAGGTPADGAEAERKNWSPESGASAKANPLGPKRRKTKDERLAAQSGVHAVNRLGEAENTLNDLMREAVRQSTAPDPELTEASINELEFRYGELMKLTPPSTRQYVLKSLKTLIEEVETVVRKGGQHQRR